MTQESSASVYRGVVVSARSRRLRTIGLLLLVAVVGMASYGYFSLMPAFRQASARVHREMRVSGAETIRGDRKAPAVIPGNAHAAPPLSHARKALLTQLYFLYAYWTVCTLLVTAVLFVAWLDLREVLRNYLNQRRALWTETADNLRRNPIRNESPKD